MGMKIFVDGKYLGERDAKNLRGGKGEDLIFAGTPQRPRVGLAQASLHFENHKKFFPVDYQAR